MTRGEPAIEVFTDAPALATRVGARLLERLASVQTTGRVPCIVLTGGSIADELHRELVRLTPTSDVDWSRIDIWWGDERFVPADSSDRNARQAAEALLDHVDVDPDRVHEMPSSEGGGDLTQAAAAYAAEVRAHGAGAFDVVMLGVGPDGHVASLFPGLPALDVHDDIAVGVRDSPKPPPERISLTFAALNRTRATWFLVTGAEKADAVARAHGGADVHEVPATGAHGSEETVWFLDEAAAARLPT
ncbi:MAG: 6-phosphogluconolactonase [Nocardioides sp.]